MDSCLAPSQKRRRCGICVKIRRAFKSSIATDFFIDIGTFEDLFLRSECFVHQAFICEFLQLSRIKEPNGNFELTKLSGQPFLNLVWCPFSNPLSGPQSSSLVLVKRRLRKRFAGHGKRLDPKWIHKKDIRRWRDACDQNHRKGHGMWSPPSHLLQGHPSWLIDTRSQCLVRASPHMVYVALSYVWGKKAFYKNVRGNLEELQNERSFCTIRGKLKIPPTIKDAIAVVNILGERYLWVDALCIVQEEENSQKHFNMMAAIYSKARITIIAEEGQDAFHGLRGLKGLSRRRKYPQRTCMVGRGLRIMEYQRPTTKRECIWSQRAWTFQEELFSHTRLIFSSGTVRWECDCGVWFEGLELESLRRRDDSPIQRQRSLFQINHPDLKGYNELVRAYNIRQLKHPQDALYAFAGITSLLSHVFKGGFLCGLPVMFFDVALLWRPRGKLIRRISSNPEVGPYIPSWSWPGWEGELDPDSWLPGCDYDYARAGPNSMRKTYRITPLVKWYSHERQDSERVLVESTCLAAGQAFFGQDRKPPPPWLRHLSPYPRVADAECSLDGCPSDGTALPRYIYTHNSVPNTAFWYPIPICTKAQDTMSCPTAPFLSCEAQRTQFRLAEEITSDHLSFSLRDEDGSWAGVIHLHEELSTANSQHMENPSVELVAISLGHAYNSMQELDLLPEWEMEERPKSSNKYEFYNVLWIDVIDGIAYRKGIGRVVKDIWDKQVLDCISLTLG